MSARIAKLFSLKEDSPHLQEALTHPSYANEAQRGGHYQRLEFLGDSVLGLCATELLWFRFPEADEGQLTRMRARLVNAEALGQWARENGLSDALLLGRGADANGLRQSTSVLSDVVEALVGAAYLDEGIEAAREACGRILEPAIQKLEDFARRDAKSELQERVQKQGGAPPAYEVIERGGPSHDPWFRVQVKIDGGVSGEGVGGSKRTAERAAARDALAKLGSLARSGDAEDEERNGDDE